MRALSLALISVLALGSLCVAQEYQEAEDFEGTTISGRVVWPGDVPGPLILEANKNAETCCEGAEMTGSACPKDSRRLVVNPENMGVQYSVVYLADYDMSTPGKEWDKELRKAVIDQSGCQYDPHVVLSQVGKKITITNSDPILHNIHAYLGSDTAFNIPQPLEGAKNKEKLAQAGSIELRCDAGHSWMTAWIHVIDHPYYAVTDADGNFELSNVPDGVYTMVVWHEGWEVSETLRNEAGDVTGYTFSDVVEVEIVDVIVDGGAVEGLEGDIELRR